MGRIDLAAFRLGFAINARSPARLECCIALCLMRFWLAIWEGLSPISRLSNILKIFIIKKRTPEFLQRTTSSRGQARKTRICLCECVLLLGSRTSVSRTSKMLKRMRCAYQCALVVGNQIIQSCLHRLPIHLSVLARTVKGVFCSSLTFVDELLVLQLFMWNQSTIGQSWHESYRKYAVNHVIVRHLTSCSSIDIAILGFLVQRE